VSSSKYLRTGTSALVTQSAFVTLTHGLLPGNADGLEIQFFTTPISEAARADTSNNGAREVRRTNYAALVLFLDKQNRIWQANLSYVIPGTTVARTIAWTPDQLRQFSQFRFDGTRIVLKSKGTYSESGEERLSLSWNVDLDLPVSERGRK